MAAYTQNLSAASWRATIEGVAIDGRRPASCIHEAMDAPVEKFSDFALAAVLMHRMHRKGIGEVLVDDRDVVLWSSCS